MTARLTALLKEGWQLLRGFAGEQAYERYVAHLAAHHPDRAPMSERQFWRERTDRGDRAAQARCC